MSDPEEAEALDEALEALETRLGGAADLAAGFEAELRRVNATFDAAGKGAARLERSLERGLRRAIDGVVFDGAKLYCYAEPTRWWSTAGEPTVCKIIDVSNGVDAGEWTVYDERENTVPTPDGEARLLWERTD